MEDQFELLNLHHDEAKAVRADDAAVPVHLWNDGMEDQFELLKLHHDEAKAVKAGDAAVPVHLWNEFVMGDRQASSSAIIGLCKLRQLSLCWYHRKLTRNCVR